MNSRRSWQLAAGRWQKAWGRTLILLCVLALSPVLQANDDGEILDASIVLTVSPDFMVKEEVSITKRLLSYQALDTDGDPRTPYCGPLQTLTITKARVTTPGGKVIDCTPNALNLSTPEALVAHPMLTGWQEMVVTFLGLEPGAQTELSYIREDKSAFRTTFEKKQILAWHFPIRKGTVTVRLPKDMALTYQIMNFQGEAAANAVADLMEYTFTFKDIPGYSDREMHNNTGNLPVIYLTTTTSWADARQKLADIANEFGSPDPAITQKANELTKDAATQLDKAINIHKFVKERFTKVEWPLQDSLLQFNSASKTFAAGQGTNLELALLLRAMLRAVKIEAEILLIGPAPLPEKAAALSWFDRAMVAASVSSYASDLEGYLTEIDWGGGLEGVLGISIDPSGSILETCSGKSELSEFWLPELPEAPGECFQPKGMVLDGNILVNDGEIVGSAILTFTGGMNPYRNNLREDGYLEQIAQPYLPMNGAKISKIEAKIVSWESTRIKVDFTSKINAGDHAIRLLPGTKAFLPDVDPRIVSLDLPIVLPKEIISVKWKIKNMGQTTFDAINISKDWGEMSIEKKQTEDGLFVSANLKLKQTNLPPADYPGLQAALAAWQNPVVAGVLLP